MISKVRFYSGKVRSKVRQRSVLSPCQCGSGAGIHTVKTIKKLLVLLVSGMMLPLFSSTSAVRTFSKSAENVGRAH